MSSSLDKPMSCNFSIVIERFEILLIKYMLHALIRQSYVWYTACRAAQTETPWIRLCIASINLRWSMTVSRSHWKTKVDRVMYEVEVHIPREIGLWSVVSKRSPWRRAHIPSCCCKYMNSDFLSVTNFWYPVRPIDNRVMNKSIVGEPEARPSAH